MLGLNIDGGTWSEVKERAGILASMPTRWNRNLVDPAQFHGLAEWLHALIPDRPTGRIRPCHARPNVARAIRTLVGAALRGWLGLRSRARDTKLSLRVAEQNLRSTPATPTCLWLQAMHDLCCQVVPRTGFHAGLEIVAGGSKQLAKPLIER